MNQQQAGTNIHQITTPHNYENFSEHTNQLNIQKHKRRSYLSIKTILSSFILMLVLMGGAAGFFLTQFTSGDLRQQAYVGESCSASNPCPSTEECVNGKCALKPVVIPKDCSFAQHNKYACETLVKCVKCVDGQKVDASRQDCANQNPNSPCKPATNTNDCGWANHGQFACKTSTECVQCVNGAMVNVNRDYCAAPCGNNTPGPQPGASCTEVKSETCTKNGKAGTKSCTYTKRSNESPFACNLNPSCGECIVPGGGDPPPPAPVCGAKNQTCCTGTTKCNTGLTCTNNKCTTPPPTEQKWSCINGECKQSVSGTYTSASACTAACGEPPVAPGAACTQTGTNSCTINGQAGTQTCTFTRRSAISPFACNQTPTNCSVCKASVQTQCTYSSNPSQNEKQCFSGNILRVCNTTNMWSIASCSYNCQGTSCCGGKDQPCCAGTNQCDSSKGLVCGTENKCIDFGPPPPPPAPNCGGKDQACCTGTNQCDSSKGLVCGTGNKCIVFGPQPPPPTPNCGNKDEPCCAGTNQCDSSKNLVCGTENKCIDFVPPPPPPAPNLGGASCNGSSLLESCGSGSGLVRLCQYTKRNNQAPYACESGKLCGQCVPVMSSNIITPEPTTQCNSQTSAPFCLGNNTVVTCLSNRWYEVDCSTKCSNGACLPPEEAELQQQLYNQATTTVQNSSVENIINDETLNILYITGLLGP